MAKVRISGGAADPLPTNNLWPFAFGALPLYSHAYAAARQQEPRRDIVWRTWEGFNQDRVLSVAAGVTFYVLLALFPAVAALVSLYGLFADRGTIGEHLSLLSGILPDGALEIIGDQVKRIAGQKSSLGFAFFGSLAISLWTANAGMKALFEAMNVVYEEDEKRSFLCLSPIAQHSALISD